MRPAARTAAALAAALASAACPSRPIDEADRLAAAGDHAGALAAYRAIARRDPTQLVAWDRAVELACRTRVDVGACLDVLDLELELLGRLDRHHDALAEVLERRARSRLDQGLVDAALEDLARAERASPDRAGVFVAKALALVARGDRAGATAALEHAATLDPKNPGIAAAAARVHGMTAEDAPFGGE